MKSCLYLRDSPSSKFLCRFAGADQSREDRNGAKRHIIHVLPQVELNLHVGSENCMSLVFPLFEIYV